MPIETASFIDDLTPSNPLSSDPAGQGDDHLRLIKSAVKGTLPNMGAVFGNVRSQDTSHSISSVWNTNHYVVSASATATVILTLPPVASITAGFYVDITTLTGAHVSLAASGGSINGAVSMSIPEQAFARAYFMGGTAWRCDKFPAGGSANVFENDVFVGGRLTVSGTAVLQSNLLVNANSGLTGALTVGGVSRFDSTVTISGAAVLGSTLLVGGAATFNSTLSVSGATTLRGGVSISGLTTTQGLIVGDVATFAASVTISGTVVLTAGQIKFPAAQNSSSDVNTLDDYEEGTWTPSFSFGSPGNLSVVYGNRTGFYTKVGRMVHQQWDLSLSTFTHTTASGSALITGSPFTAIDSNQFGCMSWGDFLFTAGYIYMCPRTNNASSTITMVISAYDTQDVATVTTTNLPTGTTPFMSGSIMCRQNT